MGIQNLVTYMEKNMSKMFGVTIIKSPFAQSTLCFSGKAQKKICINFERYDLTNGAHPTVQIWHSTYEGSEEQDPTVKSTEKVKTFDPHPHMSIEVENRSFEFWSTQKHKEI